jgi:hypothetical protein
MFNTDNLNAMMKIHILEKMVELKNLPKCRDAYIAGAYFCLYFALVYEEQGRPNTSQSLWIFLQTQTSPFLATQDFVKEIDSLSDGKIVLEESMIPNSGLRYGHPGKYYALAIKNLLIPCVSLARNAVMAESEVNVYNRYMAWVYQEMSFLEKVH